MKLGVVDVSGLVGHGECLVGAARRGRRAMSDAAAGVFISYRRQEASWLAAWLHDRLVVQFGEARVFLDIDWIRPGVTSCRSSLR